MGERKGWRRGSVMWGFGGREVSIARDWFEAAVVDMVMI